MNKKGQNGSRSKDCRRSRLAVLATGIERCHCPRVADFSRLLVPACLPAERRGLWVKFLSEAVGTTDAPVQHNLLLEYRNQPRLSDGANITILKNILITKKEKNKKRRPGNVHLYVHKCFLIIADIVKTSLNLFIYRSYLFT